MIFLNYSKKSVQWFVLLLLAFIWGSSFILMKRGMDVFSDTQVAALRIVITFLCLLPYGIHRIRTIRPQMTLALFGSAALGSGIPAFLFTKAETGISSSLAGMLNSLTPLFALIVGVLFFKFKANIWNIVGVFVALAGTVFLLSTHGGAGFNTNLLYGLFVVLATVCYSFNVNIVNRYFHDIPATTIVAVGFLFIGPVATAYLFSTDFVQKMSQHELAWQSLGYVFLLGAIGTAFSVVLYNNLMKYTSVLFSASVTYIIPVFAILWGIADNEQLNFFDFLNMIIILTGVYLVRFEKKEKTSVANA